MSSAGEFSFAIKAYDEASAVLKRVTSSLNDIRHYIRGTSGVVKSASVENIKSIREIADSIEENIGNGAVSSIFKYGESIEQVSITNKDLKKTTDQVISSIDNANVSINKTISRNVSAVAGLAAAISILKKFRTECIDVAKDTEIVAMRIKNMATALNTTSTGIANSTETVNEFINSLDNLSPRAVQAAYELASNKHNLVWISDSLESLNKISLMTGDSIEGVASALGSSNEQLLAQYGIQTDLVKEQDASIVAHQKQVEYLSKHGRNLEWSTALAEARTEVYETEINAYTEKWKEFTNTYQGALTEFNTTLSIFKNSVGKAMGQVLVPLIHFGTTLMQLVSNNKVLTYIVGIGAMISAAVLAVASASALFGRYIGNIIGFMGGLKGGFKDLFASFSKENIAAMKYAAHATDEEARAMFKEATAARTARGELMKKSVANHVDANSEISDTIATDAHTQSVNRASRSTLAYIGLAWRNVKVTLASITAKAKALVIDKLGNKESQAGIFLRIKEFVVHKQLTAALAKEHSVRQITTAGKVKDMATTVASTAKDVLHLNAIKAKTLAVMGYARALLFGSKAGKAAALDRIDQSIAIGKDNGIDLTKKKIKLPSFGGKNGGLLSGFSIFGKGGAKGILSSIGNIFSFIGKGIGAVFSALGPVKAILMVIALLVPALIALIQNSGLMEVIKNIGKTLGEVFKPIADLVGEIFTLLGDIFKAVLTPIINILSAILTPIINIIKTILEGGIAPVLMAIGKIIVSVLSVPLKLISTVLQFIFTLLSPVFSIIEMIADAITPLFDAIMPILDEALKPIMELLEPIFEILEPILSIFLKPLVKLLDMISPAIKEMGKFIKNYIQNPLETIMGIVDAIGDFFDGVGSFFAGGSNGNIIVSSAVDTTAGAKMISSASSMQAATGGMYTTNSNSGNTVTNNNGNSSITFNVTTNGNLDVNSMRNIVKDEMHRNNLRENAAFDSLNLG